MKLAWTENPDFYQYSNKHKYEYVFFTFGVILSKTTKDKLLIEVYNPTKDTVEPGYGYLRVSKIYTLSSKFPFYALKNTLTQTILG